MNVIHYLYDLIFNFFFENNNNDETIKNNIKTYDIKNDDLINKLLKSLVGLNNAGGSCYMASIIQILIHSKKFLDEFIKYEYQNKNVLTSILFDFIKEIAFSKVPSIEIKKFAENYNKINYKFNGESGNNPMTFFTEFIKKLGEENNGNILKLYMGKKIMKVEGTSEPDYEEDFIFYLITLDKKNQTIMDALYDIKEFEDNENARLIEEIKLKPEILIINLEIENIDYNFEETIWVGETEYQLKAINRYTDFHSIA